MSRPQLDALSPVHKTTSKKVAIQALANVIGNIACRQGVKWKLSCCVANSPYPSHTAIHALLGPQDALFNLRMCATMLCSWSVGLMQCREVERLEFSSRGLPISSRSGVYLRAAFWPSPSRARLQGSCKPASLHLSGKGLPLKLYRVIGHPGSYVP